MTTLAQMQQASELLSRLVMCPSVNPGPMADPKPPFGEARLADLLRSLLAEWGAEVETQETAPGRVNLIARFAGRNAKQSLLLEAHGDTVRVDDMSIPPFAAEVREGRLYGRGACDDKGPMAAMLLGIRRFIESGKRFPLTVYFVSTCDEELGAGGARTLMEGGFRADLAVVAEPTDLAIIHAHKGALRWRVHTHGVAAHSADPSRGVNAIGHMRRVIELIDEQIAPALKGRCHPLLGEATVSIGTIRGGTQANVVPAACTIEIDRRTLPAEDPEALTATLQGELEALKERVPEFAYSLEVSQSYHPLEQDLDSPVSRLAAAACRRALGEARFAAAPWASNAGVFRRYGVPCVLFGPGSIRQAHTRDEFIELEEVAAAADVYAAMIEDCAGFLV